MDVIASRHANFDGILQQWTTQNRYEALPGTFDERTYANDGLEHQHINDPAIRKSYLNECLLEIHYRIRHQPMYPGMDAQFAEETSSFFPQIPQH